MKKTKPIEILVVEDEPEILSLLQELFERRGYKVTACNSGNSALQLAQKKQFSVILTDLIMPGIDGFKLIESLKELIPISRLIVMSGAGIQVLQDLTKLGVENYIVKPIDFDNLIKTIKCIPILQFFIKP